MPELCRFYGIIIRMFAPDHAPPHFHAVYAEHEVLVTIDPIGVYAGALPRRAMSLVLEWAALHQLELMNNWHALQHGRPARRIRPLD